MKNSKVINLFNEMEKIVEDQMIAYKDDFYKWDKDRLLGCKEEGENTFYWYVRDTGTSIFDLHNIFVKDSQVNIFANYWITHNPLIYKLTITKVGRKYVYGVMEKLEIDTMNELLANSLEFNYSDPKRLQINDIRVEYRWEYVNDKGVRAEFISTLPDMQKQFYKLKVVGKKCDDIGLIGIYNAKMVG